MNVDFVLCNNCRHFGKSVPEWSGAVQMTSAWDVIETVGASVSKNFGTEGSNHCSLYRLQSFKKLRAVKFDCFKTIKYSHPLSLNADLSCLVKRILLGQALERFAAVYITPKISLPPSFFSFWDWSWTLDPCFNLTNIGITGVFHHTLFMTCWVLNPGLHVC